VDDPALAAALAPAPPIEEASAAAPVPVAAEAPAPPSEEAR